MLACIFCTTLTIANDSFCFFSTLEKGLKSNLCIHFCYTFENFSSIEALMSKTAGSIIEAALKRDPHEAEFIQSVQEAVHALERVIAKNSQ